MSPRLRHARVCLSQSALITLTCVALLLAGAVLLLAGPSAARAAGSLPEFNLLGTQGSLSGNHTTITAMNMSTGKFSGTDVTDGEHFKVTGTETGNVAKFVLVYDADTSYHSNNTVTFGLLADGNVGGPGEFTDTNGTHETYTTELNKPAGSRVPTVTVTCSGGGASKDCRARVAGSGATPTGNITFSGGSGTLSKNQCVLSGGSCAVTFTPASSSAGATGLSAIYSGDKTFRAKKSGSAKPGGSSGKPTLTTIQTSGGSSGSSISILAGTTGETDRATLSGSGAATASGSIIYTLYSKSSCAASSAVVPGSAQQVINGSIPVSAPVSNALAPGTYYWRAAYSDGTTSLSSACGAEVLTVAAAKASSTATVNAHAVALHVLCKIAPCKLKFKLTITERVAVKHAGRLIAGTAALQRYRTESLTIATDSTTIRKQDSAVTVDCPLSTTGRTYIHKHRQKKIKAKLTLTEVLKSTRITTTTSVAIDASGAAAAAHV